MSEYKMPEIFVGRKRQVFSTILLLHDGEIARVKFYLPSKGNIPSEAPVDIDISFEKDGSTEKPKMRFETAKDRPHIIFTNWTKIGTAMTKPVLIGTTSDNENLEVIASGNYITSVYSIILQFTLEKING